MLQDTPPLEAPRRPEAPRRRRWLVVLAAVVVVLVVGYLVAQHYTSQLFALAPGSTEPVQDAITVKAPPGQVHTHKGRLLLVTVSLRNVRPFSYVFDELDPNVQVVSQGQLVGNSKPSQLGQMNAVQMQDSTQTAAVVALERLGYKVEVQNVGAQVQEVTAKSPADGHLVPGDTITAFDGTPIATSDALVAAIRTRRPGDTATLTVHPATGADRTETVKLAQSPQGQGPPHAFLGIATNSKQHTQLPFDVSIDPGNIGGPSAGLAFTLGVMNNLSAGDLTGGQEIAATGTINPDGSVGDVGGVAQKTVAVRRAGAVAFFVPRDEYQTAARHAGTRLHVYKVNTLEDALNDLRSLGGDLSAIGPPPAATPATTPAA